MLRGFASFFVMIHHVKNAFFASYASLDRSDQSSFIVSTFYFITGFGQIPVLLFFVLSGFFISRSIFKMFKENKWSWVKYLIDRIIRLEVVLIPALLLTTIWDSLSHLIANSHHPVIMNSGNAGIQTFLGNLLFLQTIFFTCFGSNYPLWSLSNEFWYYIIFPLLLLLIYKKSAVPRIVILSLSMVILFTLYFKNISIIKYFLIWLLGVVPIFMPAPRNSKLFLFLSKRYKWISLIMVGIVFILFRKNFLDSFFGELIASSIFSLVIYLTINCSKNFSNHDGYKQPGFSEIFSKKIASFSYTLYLVHAPIINFLINISILYGFGLKWKPSTEHIVYHLIISIIVIVYAMAVAGFTELKTNEVRVFVSSIIQKRIK